MDYINYVKQYPMMGMIGYGGGAASLGRFSGGDAVFRGDRALVALSAVGSTKYSRIDYYNLASTGNANVFGDVTVARSYGGSVAGGGGATASRGVFGAGSGASGGTNILDYVTIGSTGNATDFGDLNYASGSGESCSNGIRGIFAHGYGNPSGYTAAGKIDFITISTTGNATSFGSMKSSGYWYSGSACASDQGRGVFGGGSPGAQGVYYIQISTEANATSAGNLLYHERLGTSSASDGTRGTWWGNHDNGAIDYLTLDSLGNASDFGDMFVAVQYQGGTANDTRGTANGGDNDDGYKNTIQYVTIQTTANAQDFGDLTAARRYSQGHSGT
jgi:hypothetical protein